MDTKGTKELIKALNPEYELRAQIKKEEEFVETRKLAQDQRKKSVFQQGVNYLSRKLKRKSKKINSKPYVPLITRKRSKVSNILSK